MRAQLRRWSDFLRRDGYQVRHYDPLVPEFAYDSLESVLLEADFVALLVGHQLIVKEMKALSSRLAEFVHLDRLLVCDWEARALLEGMDE